MLSNGRLLKTFPLHANLLRESLTFFRCITFFYAMMKCSQMNLTSNGSEFDLS